MTFASRPSPPPVPASPEGSEREGARVCRGLVSDAGARRGRGGTTDAGGSQRYQGDGGREVAGLSPSEPGMRV